MFGYIKPQNEELLVREYEFYKSVYCGLCKVGGKKFSPFMRFFLNNDFVFLCIVRMAVTNEQPCAKQTRCPYSLKKKCMVCESDAMIYTCAVFGILLYYKICDDIKDLRGAKKIPPLFLKIFARGMHKKAARLYPEIETEVKSQLEKLSELESSGCALVDKCADCFAAITKTAAGGGTTGREKLILEECGYHIGRYIYIIDAFEDCIEDEKKHNFNPLNNMLGSSEKVIEACDDIKLTLKDSINAFCRSYELLGGSKFDNLIYNTAERGSENAFAKSVAKLKGNNK